MSATSEALSGQAETLQASIAFFRIGDEAGHASAVAPAPASAAPAATVRAPAKAKAEPMRGLAVSIY
jgi:methyl-accepting chemotaxis protein